MPRALSNALLWVLVVATLLCQPAGERGAALAMDREALSRKRLIYRFNFEERQQGNFEDLPRHWFPIGRQLSGLEPNFTRQPIHVDLMARAGFSAHGAVRFDSKQAFTGSYSLRMSLSGSNVGAFLEVGALPTIPQSDYMVTAIVRTTEMVNAGAHLTAYFIDAHGKRIEASIADSGPIRTTGKWQTVSVRLLGDYPGAVWIGMELSALQPARDVQSALGKHRIVYEDVAGDVWFDDVTLWQLPRVSIETQSTVNVIRQPERPRLAMSVRDLTGQALSAQATIYDHRMVVVAKMEQPVGGGAPSNMRWIPKLPKLGWYLVDLVVRDPSSPTSGSESLPVARSLGAFLWLGEDGPLDVSEASRFTLDAQGLPDDQMDLLPTLMDQSGLESVVISCWSRKTTRATLDDRAGKLEGLVQNLLSRSRRVTVSLDPVPDELALASDVDTHSPASLFIPGKANWTPYLAPILMRQGQRVRRWQLGSPGYAGFLATRDLPSLVSTIHREFAALMPQPTLVLPWRLDVARPRGLSEVDQFAVEVPSGIRADYIPQHTAEWRVKSATPGGSASAAETVGSLSLRLRVPSATELTHPQRVEDLAVRMLRAWQAGADGVSLPQPWTFVADRQTSLLPDPLLGVFSSVSRRLAGRKYLGSMPLRGAECMIFGGATSTGPTGATVAVSGGMLAVWTRGADASDSTMEMYLGAHPRLIDVFGNRSEPTTIGGKHRVELSSTPIFIEGIDPALALFRASFKVDPPFIESLQVPHERNIVMTNPWSRTISGTLYVLRPDDWNIQPRRTTFSIAAGQTTSLPMQIMLPVSEIAGTKRMVVRLDFTAEQRYTIDIPVDLTLGLKDVDFDAQLTIETDQKTGIADLVVTQLITNTGSRTLSLYAFSSLSGVPRQERVLAGLMPGQSTYRRFRFVGAGDRNAGASVRVGLRETGGPAVLNKVLTLDAR
jgi:hypothetical protein